MIYQCAVCGYTYDEAQESKLWDALDDAWVCPVCTSERKYFQAAEADDEAGSVKPSTDQGAEPLAYAADYLRTNDSVETHMDSIHEMAVTGRSIVEPMRTKHGTTSWDDIFIVGAQLDPLPLNDDEPVSTRTVIGKRAKHPLVLDSPIFVSHMSFGALSKELKIALAKGTAVCKTAMCSGEGGILPEEMEASYKYIFEYVPNRYSVTPENLRAVDAIEIKIGQGTKPGMGGHLPAEKVTEEIAQVRNKPVNQDVISPARFADVKTKDDLKGLVSELRERSGGKPIGIKLAAGHIERDLEVAAYARPDFVTIDGRGGATGATYKFVKDAASVPTIFALHRARKFLDDHHHEIDLVITGGLRVSSDFAKALAMGADAIAIATSALMAAVCQQYRVCDKGQCPVGGATQDPKLRSRLHIDHSAARLANFLHVSSKELQAFARLTGRSDVHGLCTADLCTANSEISNHTAIPHA